MPGTSSGANYKAIQRFLKVAEPKQALLRLFDENAPTTEVERPYAKRTRYVGRLSDGKTLGFWLPYAGRTIPFAFICYSEKTLNEELTSRNLQHQGLFGQVKGLVLDREFSYLGQRPLAARLRRCPCSLGVKVRCPAQCCQAADHYRRGRAAG